MSARDPGADSGQAAAAAAYRAAIRQCGFDTRGLFDDLRPLPEAVQRTVLAFVDACSRARASIDPGSAIAVQQSAAAVNRALASAELGYYVDAQVVRMADGRLRVFAQTFVVEHVGLFLLGAHTERALSIRRLDHTNVDSATLGFTRPEANEGLVQVDRIEEHLVAHLPSGHPERITLLTDGMSPVAGFEAQQMAFFSAMRQAGVRLATMAETVA